MSSDYTRRSLVVNRAQAHIWGGKRKEGLAILDAEDWSAARDEFHVCVAALRQQFDLAIKIMKAIGASSRPGKSGYRNWPVFKELRKTEEFQATFVEVFGEPFATVTISPPTHAPSSSDDLSTSSDDTGGGPDEPPIVH